MGTEKRERQKANRAAKQEAEQRADARARRLRTLRNAVLAAVAIVVVMVLVSVLGGCASEPAEEPAAGSGAEAGYGTGACAPADGVDEPVLTFADAPQRCIDPDATYTATFATTKGDIVVDLDPERAPFGVNNFVNLARYGYYDGTDLHRVVAEAGFVQGGSPHTQDASDIGPGYTMPDEGTYTAEDYVPGVLAMARTAQYNSGGQFFFLAHEGGTEALASVGNYVVLGQTTEGLDLLEQIAALDDGTERPTEQVVVESVTITES